MSLDRNKVNRGEKRYEQQKQKGKIEVGKCYNQMEKQKNKRILE